MNEVTKAQSAPPADAIHGDPIVSIIEKVAQTGDIEALERMLDMKRQLDADRAKQAFAAAFALASAKFPPIPLNGTGHNNKPYALLKDIVGHTRPVLSEHGLALTFSIEVKDVIRVTAELMHKDGHTKSTTIDLPRDTSGSKNAVQAVGSSQTYGQRYTAQAVLGLSLGDDTEDDGRGSGDPKEKPAAPRDPWAHAILSELAEDATPRDKAVAITQALCAQWQRMKGIRQLGNEWDRRVHLIDPMEERHPDLHETIVDGYETRKNELEERG